MKTKVKRSPILGQRGVSLVELLIAVTLTVLIGAVMLEFYISQHNQYLVQEDISDMQQNVRVAMDEITKNVRKAGYGLVGHPSIHVSTNRIRVYYQNGTQIDTLLYYISREDISHPHLMKKVGSGYAQVFAENIDSLIFNQSGQLIYVRIVAREDKRDEDFGGDQYRRRTYSSFVKVRNTI